MNREKGVRHNVNIKKVYTAIQVNSGCIPKSKGGGGNEMKGPVQQEVDQRCRVLSGGSPWNAETMSSTEVNAIDQKYMTRHRQIKFCYGSKGTPTLILLCTTFSSLNKDTPTSWLL
jgi:hypothetical protein